MKKFFTNLSKCSSAIIVVTILAHTFSASADEYKSMIRYDRVWECYSDGHDDPDLVVKCMKFVGTEEINGKTYHKIETFRKTFPRIDYATDTYDFSNYIDGLHQHEGYLREENGLVYVPIVGVPVTYPEYHGVFEPVENGRLYIPGKNDPVEYEVIVEMPIYDFTRKLGETYEGVSFGEFIWHTDIFTVNRDECIEIGGEEYRRICLLPERISENEYYYGEEVIEGIGATEDGCLNYHEMVVHPTRSWAQNYFTRLLDLDGNVLYNPRPYPMFDIPYGSFETLDGVDLVDASVADAPCFDILGRRIAEPAPGQLYIRNGKKHIAK